MHTGLIRSVSGASVIGPRHVRAGRVNEDALGWRSFDRSAGELRTVAVVSDGHGSDVCSRSERGSALAVQAALQAAAEVVASVPAGTPDRAWMLVEHSRQLWLSAVDQDLARDPLPAHQRDRILAAGGEIGDERIAYGCTLLVCAVTEQEVLVGQIGDGEITAVTPDASGWFPLEPNPVQTPGASDSLCLPGAEHRARTVTFDARLPALLLLMTDGVTNAYTTREELLMVGADTVTLERGTGLRRANLTLESWLASTAERTEDDATIVAVWM